MTNDEELDLVMAEHLMTLLRAFGSGTNSPSPRSIITSARRVLDHVERELTPEEAKYR